MEDTSHSIHRTQDSMATVVLPPRGRGERQRLSQGTEGLENVSEGISRHVSREGFQFIASLPHRSVWKRRKNPRKGAERRGGQNSGFRIPAPSKGRRLPGLSSGGLGAPRRCHSAGWGEAVKPWAGLAPREADLQI